MKTLLVTDARAFADVPDLGAYFDDNGGEGDGNAWLPNLPEELGPESALAQAVVQADMGQFVEAFILRDAELSEFDDDEDALEDYLEQRFKDAWWAHYGAYGCGYSVYAPWDAS